MKNLSLAQTLANMFDATVFKLNFPSPEAHFKISGIFLNIFLFLLKDRPKEISTLKEKSLMQQLWQRFTFLIHVLRLALKE